MIAKCRKERLPDLVSQAFRLEDRDRRGVAQGKMLHCHLVDFGGDGDMRVALVGETDGFAEGFDHVAEIALVDPKGCPHVAAGKHIDMPAHVFLQIQPHTAGLRQRFKRLDLCFEQLQIADAVDAVVGDA